MSRQRDLGAEKEPMVLLPLPCTQDEAFSGEIAKALRGCMTCPGLQREVVRVLTAVATSCLLLSLWVLVHS